VVHGAALEKRMGLCQLVFSCDAQPHFVSGAGHNKRLSYHLVTPHPIQCVSKSVSKKPIG